MPRRSTPQDFWKHVDRTVLVGCWPWSASLGDEGYGRVRYQGKEWRASRLAWALTHGDPGPLCVLHHCDNPPCCNPNHLFLGTHKDNMQDSTRKGRHPRNKTGYLPSGARHHSALRPEVVARGERNGSAKLTEASVLAIRREHAAGVSWRNLASAFNVAKGTIGFIVHRKTWAHLPEE